MKMRDSTAKFLRRIGAGSLLPLIAKLIEPSLRLMNHVTAFLFAPLFRNIARHGYGGNICLRWGFLPLPVHYYSPVPDIEDLRRRKVWTKKTTLTGIDFNPTNQIALLHRLGERYGKECQWPTFPTANPADFHLAVDNFSYGCASALHTMIREYRPRHIIEIGSGNSSKIISKALEMNSPKIRYDGYTIIDPYPKDYIKDGMLKNSRLRSERVELIEPSFFDALGENDILFIDSSHVVKIADDVNFLYLEILPRLNPGVVVHVHDITLPDEYPSVYALRERSRQFWTEQYLLQAFLTHNAKFEILMAMHYLQRYYPDDFQTAFPYYDSKTHTLGSSSFWMRRIPNAN